MCSEPTQFGKKFNSLTLPELGGGGGRASRPAASNTLMQHFIDLSNCPKIYLGKFSQKIFFSYFIQLLLTSSFFDKVNPCEIENYIYFDAMVEMVYFLEYFLSLQNNYFRPPVFCVFCRYS